MTITAIPDIPADLGSAGSYLAKDGAAGAPDLPTILTAMKTAIEEVQADPASIAAELTAIALLQKTHPSPVRGVCFSNMSVTAFVGVAGGTAQDGITYVAGERVLLANQTTAAQNGIYVVGTVGSGVAPLTRAADMPAAAPVVNGCIVEVSEGTIFAGSTWKAMCTGAKVVGTDDPNFFPRVCKGILTLAAGTYTLGATEGLFLFSTTKSVVKAGFNTAGGTVSATVNWRCASAGRTAGKSGTAAATIIATVAAGTIDTDNASTMDFEITNW